MELGVTLEVQRCVRARDTPPQVSLPWDERKRNVRGAFQWRGAFEAARVAVVDDVMTTGATLEELARTLKRAGASEVVGWVVARTERR
jgi:predicted amidophosphoribosyltransferase